MIISFATISTNKTPYSAVVKPEGVTLDVETLNCSDTFAVTVRLMTTSPKTPVAFTCVEAFAGMVNVNVFVVRRTVTFSLLEMELFTQAPFATIT